MITIENVLQKLNTISSNKVQIKSFRGLKKGET